VSRPPQASSFATARSKFQSRAGFSECLDTSTDRLRCSECGFQSRAGFSECLDPSKRARRTSAKSGFNPVLGFLSVSTEPPVNTKASDPGFNPVLGFLSVSTIGRLRARTDSGGFQSRAGFSECLDHRCVYSCQIESVSIPCWVF